MKVHNEQAEKHIMCKTCLIVGVAAVATVLLCGCQCGDTCPTALDEFPVWSVPRRITSGPREHLLASYFGIDCWSPSHRYVLALETTLNGKIPDVQDRATVGIIDLQDDNRFIPVSTTGCWNFQEAAMGHWLDDDTVVFNDLRDGKFVTVVLNLRTKDERLLPHPVAAVSKDRTWAVSVNFARLRLTRPDYGYPGEGQDPRRKVTFPEDDGIWSMDLRTGESKLILSVADVRGMIPAVTQDPTKPGNPLAYFCHTAISADGKKVFFLARSVNWYDEKTMSVQRPWFTTAFTMNRDGSELRRCFPDGWGGSHFNWAPDGTHRMVVTGQWNGSKEYGHIEFEVGKEDGRTRLAGSALGWDGHCIYSPDMKFLSTDGYRDQSGSRRWVQVRLADGEIHSEGRFFVPAAYMEGPWRCDLHARYRPDGRQLAFNSAHEGSRQIYLRDVTKPVVLNP